jgi:hydrogenase-4 component B
VLATVLLTRSELVGRPAASTDTSASQFVYTYRVGVVDLVERYFYRPLTAAVLYVSRAARRLQSGRLDAYMAYMLIAVLAVLAVVIATA